tara:strand:+ start:343 stop:534 length:192 start_codon:yes stop_codon:yes gene_type:complete
MPVEYVGGPGCSLIVPSVPTLYQEHAAGYPVNRTVFVFPMLGLLHLLDYAERSKRELRWTSLM